MPFNDLFDDNNPFYREAVDNPFEIIQPHGREFFLKKSTVVVEERIQSHSGSHETSQNDNLGETAIGAVGSFRQSLFQQEIRAAPPRDLVVILEDKVNQLELISYNKVSQRQTDFSFLKAIKPQMQEKVIQVISDYEFNLVVSTLKRQERINAVTAVIDKINMEKFNLKSIKMTALLRCVPSFLEKKRQLSTFYHVIGNFECLEYIDVLKSEVESTLTTSLLSLWLQQSKQSSRTQGDSQIHHIGEVNRWSSIDGNTSCALLREYIGSVRQAVLLVDDNFEGFDLYLGLRRCATISGYVEQEIECWKWMLIDLILICFLLGDKQNCMIKFYQCFTAKTLQVLYLYQKAFQTMVMVKPNGSSLASNQRYLVCSGLKGAFAKELGEVLIAKYEEFSKENMLLFELKVLTQDQKFYLSFIEKYLRNLLRLQIEYYRCEMVKSMKYSEVFKVELKRVFAEAVCQERIHQFISQDDQFSKEIGITYVDYDAVGEQMFIGNASQQLQQQLNEEQMISNKRKKKRRQVFDGFSDEEYEDRKEEDESSAVNLNRGLVGQFIEFSKEKQRNEQLTEQEKEEKEKKKQLNNGCKQSRKRRAEKQLDSDSLVINEKEDRDLSYTRELMVNLGILPLIPRKKKQL